MVPTDSQQNRKEAAPARPAPSFAACTIVSKNYLSLARVWNASVQKHHPGTKTFVLIVDRIEGAFDPSKEPFEVIEVERLGIPGFQDLAFKYSILELNTAVKPFLLEYLFRTRNVERLVYLDPDTVLYGPIEKVEAMLETFNIVLIPHILSPQALDGRKPDEIDFLISGSYNLGFIGLKKCKEVSSFLRWWQDKLWDGCFSAVERGLFTDQKWIDLVPSIFSGVGILRDRGYNVAYWNLHERMDIEEFGDGYRFPECPLAFFHFSGFEFSHPARVSKYQNRFRLHQVPEPYRDLYRQYADAVRDAGFEQTRKLPYAFEFFDDGVRIPPLFRKLYYQQGAERDRWGDPFRSKGEDTFRDWLFRPTQFGSRIPRLVSYLYSTRPDVRAAIQDGEGANQRALLSWAWYSAAPEYKIDDSLRANFRKLMDEIDEENAIRLRSAKGEKRAAEVPVVPFPHLPWLHKLVGRNLATGVENFLFQKRKHEAELRAAGVYDGEAREPIKQDLQRMLTARGYRKARFWIWHYRFWLNRLKAARRARAEANASRRRPRSNASAISSGPDSAPYGVNVFGYFDTESGVGEIARSMSAMLRHAEVPNALVNIGQPWMRRNDLRVNRFSTSNPYAINLFMVNADQMNGVARGLGAQALEGRINIGYWFWEVSRFPRSYFDPLDFLDEVWVSSNFCLDAISAASPVPVVKVRPGFDFEEPRGRRKRRSFGIEEDDFVFLYVFDSYSVLARKNPAGAIRAFRTAFPKPGKERLVLKTINAEPREVAAYQRLARSSRVDVHNEYLDRFELLDLLAAADCYLSLHRGEGLGLTLLESMAMGKPVIATDYSGSEEFLKMGLGFPVRYRLVQLVRKIHPYEKGNVWADPDIEEAARWMRFVRENRAEATRVGAAARNELHKSWSIEASSARLRERVDRLLEALPRTEPVNLVPASLPKNASAAVEFRRLAQIKAK